MRDAFHKALEVSEAKYHRRRNQYGGMKATLNIRELFFRQHQIRGSFMGSLGELRRGLKLLAAGQVKAVIDRTYPLKDVAEAHRYIDSRAVRGKVELIP